MRFLLISIFAWCGLSFGIDAVVRTIAVNTAVNNLAATYNTSFPQLALTNLERKQHIAITNETGTKIYCQTLAKAMVAPSPGDQSEVSVPGGSIKVFDDFTVGANVYCRGASAISSGTFTIETW